MSKLAAEKLLIGAHTSAQGGAHNALYEGQRIGATTIQLFTSNQKTWKGKVITDEEAALWKEALAETGIKKVMSHDSYLINLGSPKKEILTKSCKAFIEELERCHKLDIAFLNFHPGSATGSTEEDCLNTIVKNIREIEGLCAKGNTRLLFESTAGQGTNVGYCFEHLGYLVDRLKDHVPIGVCIDTCHIFAAGYDVRTKEAWEETLAEFSKHIGMKHLYAIHVNDSMKPFESRKDRHANLGEGEIGINGFKAMMQHPKLRDIPKCLETPAGPDGWQDEIKLLRKFAQ